MFMILTEPEKGLASPYSRIIFAMSISDILFSLGFLLSPFLGPKDNPDALFAIGTTGSCEAIGFLFLLGFQCLLFYIVFLTYYFMRRIKYKVTAKDFEKKEEKYLHRVIVLISLVMATTAFFAGSINPQGYGSLCGTSPYPEYCEGQTWEGEPCKRGDDQITKYLNIYGGVLAGSSLLSISLILALTSSHVYKQERALTIPARAIGDVNRRNPGEAAPENVQGEIDRNIQNRHALTKQALTQSFLYILAFIVVYFPPGIGILRIRFGNATDLPEWLFWLISLTTPFGGVFNILIYTRPKVLRLKEDYPNASFLRVFVVIVLTGGEIPSLADLRRDGPPQDEQRNNRNNLQVSDLSEEEQFNEDEMQVNESQYGLSYEMDVSAASDYLSHSRSCWRSSSS
ncbi:hypothetical protein CTEN210_01036 [Chaetoceros tenuissimus]|uniref:G-protein coupled receptors family 1 profile domain-containing protein n=1 Tax=Chaetoceros tenuissimus TaxID=426638 RepID=A0AAD3CEC7_9STRA|nr:hypothetical protein CTEN210_01036 [Chaetoceros tenuissimus]